MSSIFQSHLRQRINGIRAWHLFRLFGHPWVIRAAAEQAVEDGLLLLLEATSNQVNQFGGCTGMRPEAFRTFVFDRTEKAGLSREMVILGGDHLGPNPWRKKPVDQATVPLNMYSRYLPSQYQRLRQGMIANDPASLVVDAIRDILKVYAAACFRPGPADRLTAN